MDEERLKVELKDTKVIMKFGSNLPRNQVPEWASQYIKYKALKKLIKTAAEDARQGGSADTAGIVVMAGDCPGSGLIAARVLLLS